MLLKPIQLRLLPTPPTQQPEHSCSSPHCAAHAAYEITYHSANPTEVEPGRTILYYCEHHVNYFLQSNFSITRLPDAKQP